MPNAKGESFILSKLREVEKWIGFETDVDWTKTFVVLGYHVLAIYWCYHYTFPVKWQSVAFAFAVHVFSGFGVIAGAHRYWSHRAFKATTPLRVLMIIGFAAAGQLTLYTWVRNHRIHHKYSDTEYDPHNGKRGLFFAHIGWLLMKKNEKVKSKFKETDMTDIVNDPIVVWHTKYAAIINPLACFIIPPLAGTLLCGEDWRVAVAWQCGIRLLLSYHSTFAINSVAHAVGDRPYNKSIRPADNFIVSVITAGEGYHNYHHAFPFDYKSAERCHVIDRITHAIHFFESLGWVYDKKEASKDAIKRYSETWGEAQKQEKGF